MVDFVKVQLINAKEALEKSDLLDFIGEHSTKTGEVNQNKKRAKYKGLDFIIYNTGYVLMQGSLHKYMNEGKHNYNDFSFEDLQKVLTEISKKFNLDLKDCIIKNIEFGVNIIPPVKTESIINNLLIHGGKIFKDVSLKSGNYKQAVHVHYIVKCYDKGLHFHLDYNLLRFELKYRKMLKINNSGIYTLSDLMYKQWIKPVQQLLITEWGKVLLFEQTTNVEALNAITRQKKVHQWSSANYWFNLSKQQRTRQKKAYVNYVNAHTNNHKSEIEKLILEKWNYLKLKCVPIYTSIIG